MQKTLAVALFGLVLISAPTFLMVLGLGIGRAYELWGFVGMFTVGLLCLPILLAIALLEDNRANQSARSQPAQPPNR